MPTLIDVCHLVPLSSTRLELPLPPDLDDSSYKDLPQEFPPPSPGKDCQIIPACPVEWLHGHITADEGPRRYGIIDISMSHVERTAQVRTPAQLPHIHWNVYKRVKQDLSCTNNSLEGWHCGPARTPILNLNWLGRLQNFKALNQQRAPSHREERTDEQGKYQLIGKKLKTLVGKLDEDVVGVHFLGVMGTSIMT